MEKAIKEAQVQTTSWVHANEEYEEAVAHFVETLLSPAENNLFLPEFLPFQRKVARLDALNSLSQTLMKLTVLGVPDVYQGNDLWVLVTRDDDKDSYSAPITNDGIRVRARGGI